MQNKVIKKEFFKKNEIFKNKEFLINANDEILLDENDNKFINTGVYFKLHFRKIEQNLEVNISLYAWCNNKQKYVPLKNSIWREKGFGDSKHIPKIEAYYKRIIENFLILFEKMKYYWQLKEVIHKLENPTFIFHYKLINTFSEEILKKIFIKDFNNYPILNISYLKTNKLSRFNCNYIFLNNYIQGFFIDGIEVCVDLNESNYVIIEDTSNGIVITKEEFLGKIIY